jgi:hypothetical protein
MLVYASEVANLLASLGIVLTIVLVPWVIRHLPYFNRADVLARRAAKAGLPGWVSVMELLFLATSAIGLLYLFYSTEALLHGAFHPELAFLPSVRASFSFSLVFWLIHALAPVAAALPLAMILANLISHSIPSIREAENRVIAENVPGYTWAELNMGLLRAAAIIVPVSVILAVISVSMF